MIKIKKGDLVISGINVSKGAISIYEGEKDIKATIHYSSYEFDKSKIYIDYLKFFFKSQVFIKLIKEKVKGGIKTEIKPKHLLPLEINLPTLKNQKIIANLLKEKINKVETLNDMIFIQETDLKQLHQAILQEAIQGKLVPQNPDDEPAAELLQRIKTEKAALIKAKKIRKEKPLPPITEEEKPFELPEGWVWCRLGEVVTMSRGRFSIRPRNDPRYFGGIYPFIQIGSLDSKGSIITKYKQTLNEEGRKASKMFPQGTIVIAIVGGTIGNLGVLGIDMCFTDSIVGITPRNFYNQDYILNYLKHKQKDIKAAGYQMAGQPNIKIPTLTNLLIPLPPFPEQNRIVAKVESLLTLSKTLSEQVQRSQSDAEVLMQAVLQEAFAE